MIINFTHFLYLVTCVTLSPQTYYNGPQLPGVVVKGMIGSYFVMMIIYGGKLSSYLDKG